MEFEYQDLVGIPFVDRGRDPSTGLDCWGLARECFYRQGINVYDYSISALAFSDIAETISLEKCRWNKIEVPEIGCLVLLRLEPNTWANHVGIYVGKGRFIHAYAGAGVCVDRLKHWKSRVIGYYKPPKEGEEHGSDC